MNIEQAKQCLKHIMAEWREPSGNSLDVVYTLANQAFEALTDERVGSPHE